MSAQCLAPLAGERYVIWCQQCSASFDAAAAPWCGCGDTSRTLVCPTCSACFCRAPIPYKRRVWERAPRWLRESPQRFGRVDREAVAAHAAPVVLIVDDDESLRSLVACVVENLGYRTITTADPLEAMLLAQSASVQVVLTDALMPRLDGRELCLRLKESPSGESKKVVIMTSLFRKRQYHEEAFRVFRCDDYLLKPIDFDRLAEVLERLAPLNR
ncbi:MAG TPA: response regulator [Thermoanaerobaculia bacterium]|nr:response regulator [Thermoanaerobaculia bacterium]